MGLNIPLMVRDNRRTFQLPRGIGKHRASAIIAHSRYSLFILKERTRLNSVRVMMRGIYKTIMSLSSTRPGCGTSFVERERVCRTPSREVAVCFSSFIIIFWPRNSYPVGLAIFSQYRTIRPSSSIDGLNQFIRQLAHYETSFASKRNNFFYSACKRAVSRFYSTFQTVSRAGSSSRRSTFLWIR